MIDIKSLRIGNIIKGVNSEVPIKVHRISISEEGCAINTWDSRLFDPIPITEEILLKCEGVEKVRDGVFDFDIYRFGYFALTEDGVYPTSQSQQVGEPKKYLHELQNLIKSLTNKELQINL